MLSSHSRTRPPTRTTVLVALVAVATVACGPRFDRAELTVGGVPATEPGTAVAAPVGGEDGSPVAGGTGAGAEPVPVDGSRTGAGDDVTTTAGDPGAATDPGAGGEQAGAGDATSSASPGGTDTGTAPSGGGTSQVAAGPQPGITDDTIRIGYLVPLTGAAPIPTSWDDGANLYWNVKNAAGGINGRRVELYIEDTESSTTTAVNKARKLLTQQKVFTIVTLDRLEVQEAVARELEARKVPHVMIQSPTPPPASWTNTFTVSIDHTVQGRAIARFWHQELASVGRKVAVVREQTNALKPGADAMVAEAERLGLDVVANETIDPSAADFTQTILRLQRNGAQIVWLYMAPTPAARIIGQAGASSYRPTWFANSISWNFELMHGVTAGYMDGKAYAFSPWVPLSDPRAGAYKKAWNACGPCSGEPDDIGLVGWGVGGVLDAALSKPGRELGHDSFRSGLRSLRIATDVWAPLDFTGGGSVGTTKVAVFRSQGGAWRMAGDFRSF